MSLRTNDLLEAVRWTANDQHGLITAAQLAEIGIPRSSLSRRIRTGGAWRRVLPGVYLVTDGPMSILQRERAAVLFAGADAVVSGASGLRLRGIEHRPDDPLRAAVHTLIPVVRHRKSAGFVIVERTQRMPTSHIIDGLPVADLARCLVDAARRVTDRRASRAMVLEAVQRSMVGIDAIDRELHLAQRRGTSMLREILAEARAGVRSVPEAELRQLAEKAQLPAIWWNPTLWTPNGDFVAMPDGVVVDSMAVIEVQSRKYHDEDESFAATLARAERLGRQGLLITHVVPTAMRRNPNATLRAIADTHGAALGRPRPTLLLHDSRGVHPQRFPFSTG